LAGVKFLGTAGARYVMATQFRSSAGVYIEIKGKRIILDPGPGTLVRMAKSRPRINPSSTDAVILSHIHLDHAGDVNAVLDAMTEGAKKKRGFLFAPSQCVEGRDRVILSYLLSSVNILVLKPESSYSIEGIELETSPAHDHGVETYGIKFPLENGKLCFMVDTKFSPQLLSSYKDCRYIVMNVVLKECRDFIKHLCVEDVKTTAEKIRPDEIVITHFGMGMLRAKPWELAERLSRETEVNIKAASDGMQLTLD